MRLASSCFALACYNQAWRTGGRAGQGLWEETAGRGPRGACAEGVEGGLGRRDGLDSGTWRSTCGDMSMPERLISKSAGRAAWSGSGM